jgi:hypothetical protein
MLLIMIPAIEGLKREWREAAENLGASTAQYWLRVGLPVLMPSLLGTMLLLFGNAFGAYATAYGLTGGNLQLITIQTGRTDARRCAAQPQPGLCHGAGHGRHHGRLHRRLYLAAAPVRALAEIATKEISWLDVQAGLRGSFM